MRTVDEIVVHRGVSALVGEEGPALRVAEDELVQRLDHGVTVLLGERAQPAQPDQVVVVDLEEGSAAGKLGGIEPQALHVVDGRHGGQVVVIMGA